MVFLSKAAYFSFDFTSTFYSRLLFLKEDSLELEFYLEFYELYGYDVSELVEMHILFLPTFGISL